MFLVCSVVELLSTVSVDPPLDPHRPRSLCRVDLCYLFSSQNAAIVWDREVEEASNRLVLTASDTISFNTSLKKKTFTENKTQR